jgi:hypothetical protein
MVFGPVGIEKVEDDVGAGAWRTSASCEPYLRVLIGRHYGVWQTNHRQGERDQPNRELEARDYFPPVDRVELPVQFA